MLLGPIQGPAVFGSWSGSRYWGAIRVLSRAISDAYAAATGPTASDKAAAGVVGLSQMVADGAVNTNAAPGTVYGLDGKIVTVPVNTVPITYDRGATENRFAQSDDISQSAWGKVLLVAPVAGTPVTLPVYGTLTPRKLVPTASTGQHFVSQSVGMQAAGTKYLEALVSAAEWSRIALYWGGAPAGGVWFDLAAKTVIGSGNAALTGRVEDLGQGVLKLTVEAQQATSGGASVEVHPLPASVGVNNYNSTGDGTAGIWVYRLACGTRPNPAIVPTTTTALYTNGTPVRQNLASGNGTQTVTGLRPGCAYSILHQSGGAYTLSGAATGTTAAGTVTRFVASSSSLTLTASSSPTLLQVWEGTGGMAYVAGPLSEYPQAGILAQGALTNQIQDPNMKGAGWLTINANRADVPGESSLTDGTKITATAANAAVLRQVSIASAAMVSNLRIGRDVGTGKVHHVVGSGPNLVANGSFDTDISGWTAAPGYPNTLLSWSSGALKIAGTGTAYFEARSQQLAWAAGEWVLVRFRVVSTVVDNKIFALISSSASADNPDRISLLSSSPVSAGTTYSFLIKPSFANGYLWLATNGVAGQELYVDDVSAVVLTTRELTAGLVPPIGYPLADDVRTQANPWVGAILETSGDAVTVTYAAACTGAGAVAGAVQYGTPLPIAASAQTRNADQIAIPGSALGLASSAGTVMAVGRYLSPAAGVSDTLLGTSGGAIALDTTGGFAAASDGTNTATTTAAVLANTTIRQATAFDSGGGLRTSANGGSVATASFDGTMGSELRIGYGSNVLVEAIFTRPTPAANSDLTLASAGVK